MRSTEQTKRALATIENARTGCRAITARQKAIQAMKVEAMAKKMVFVWFERRRDGFERRRDVVRKAGGLFRQCLLLRYSVETWRGTAGTVAAVKGVVIVVEATVFRWKSSSLSGGEVVRQAFHRDH